MNSVVAGLTARSVLGRRRVFVLLLVPAALLLLCGAVRLLAGSVDTTVTVGLLGGFALATVVPLVGLIAGTGSIGPEIDDGSIVYLMSKPLSRHTIVVSKLAVAIGVVTIVAAVPTFLAGLVLSGTTDGLAVAYGIGAVVAGIAYCALFVLLAIVTRNAVVVGLIYVLVWESLVGNFVPGAQVLSVQQWALAITERMIDSTAGSVFGVDSAVSFGSGLILLGIVIAGCAWYAGSRLRALRLTGSE